MNAYNRSFGRYAIFAQEFVTVCNLLIGKLKLGSRTDGVNSMPSEHFKVASNGMYFAASPCHAPMRSANKA